MGGYLRNNYEDDRPIEFSQAAAHAFGSVLDIGPCFGAFSKYLLFRDGYVGLDICPEMAARARSNYPDRVFLVGDVLQLPDGWKGAFRTSAAFGVLEHFEEPERVIGKLWRVSTDRLLFMVPRGLPTEKQKRGDGHVSGWKDEADFESAFAAFGDCTFWRAETKYDYICGMIDWRR